MKTSNIILSIIAGTATFIILAGAVHLRVTGIPEGEWRMEQQGVKTTLAPFQYLVVRDAINFSIKKSEQGSQPFQLVTLTGKNDPSPILDFEQRGDTLIINRIGHGEKGRSLQVNLEAAPGSIKYINAQDSHLGLVDYATDKLVVDLTRAHLSIYGDDVKPRYESLRVNASHESGLHANQAVIDTLDIQLDDSDAYLNDVIKLKARVQNYSTMHTGKASDVSYQRDESSQVY